MTGAAAAREALGRPLLQRREDVSHVGSTARQRAVTLPEEAVIAVQYDDGDRLAFN
jgi:hypothetical protein